jgi:hypothetical protein
MALEVFKLFAEIARCYLRELMKLMSQFMKTSLFLILFMFITNAPANTRLSQEASAFVSSLAECVSIQGPKIQLPTTEIAMDAHLTGIPLSKGLIADDGFRHWAVLSDDHKTGYIVQIGGINGIRTVFGPFSISKKICNQAK